MNQPNKIANTCKLALILVMACLYLATPLYQPLSAGFHKLEHFVLSTNSDHAHDLAHDHDLEHSHEHKILSFFNDLFQNSEENEDQKVNKFEFDKHIVQQVIQKKKSNIVFNSENNFNHLINWYSTSLKITLPPPKVELS